MFVETEPQNIVFLRHIFIVSIISRFQFGGIANFFLYLNRINMWNSHSAVTRMMSVILDDDFKAVKSVLMCRDQVFFIGT